MFGKNVKRITGIILSLLMVISGDGAFLAENAKGESEVGNRISFEEFANSVVALCKSDEDYLSKVVLDPQNQTYSIDGCSSGIWEGNIEQNAGVCMISGELLAEVLDADFTYDVNSRIATIAKEDAKVSVEDGSNVFASFTQVGVMETAPYKKDDTLMLPAEEVIEALEMEASELSDGSVVVSDEFQTKRLIVKSKNSITDKTAIEIVDGYDDLHILQYETRSAAKEAYERFRVLDGVEFVQADGVVTTEESQVKEIPITTSKTYHSWGIEKTGMDSYMEYITANFSNLPEVVVAVLDTGVDYSHSGLSSRILDNGMNYITDSPKKKIAQDDNGHGTAVAGIVVEGTLSNVKILPIKVMNSSGEGTDSTVYLGIQYAVEQGADVLNLSLGGEGTSYIYESGIREVYERGILVIVAAGNEGADVAKVTPANVPEAITVGSTNMDGSVSSFSNYGKYIDITAPGGSVQVFALNGGYRTTNGTSFSAPHVSAAVALLKTVNYSLASEDCFSLLQGSATDLGVIGWDKYYGYGELNIEGLQRYYGTEGVLKFNPKQGTYEDSLDVYLESTDENAVIYYTTDGTEPTNQNGSIYTGPIHITESTSFKAIAYLDGFPWSNVISESYTITQLTKEFEVQDGVLVKYNGSSDELLIPQSFEGQVITAISGGAFDEAIYIRSVTIPDTIESIGESAFAACEYLDTVLISKKVQTIGKNAFSKNSVIYCAKGSPAEQYAIDNAYSYRNTPLIVTQPDKETYVAYTQDLVLRAEAIGFNLSYQWYQTPDGTTEAAVAIEGATQADYNPDLTKTGTVYYYVEVTGTEDGESTLTISRPAAVTTYAQRGDLDADGEVTPSDALLILQSLVKKKTLNNGQTEIADVDDDSSVTANDALMILKYIAELIDEI